MLEFSIKWLGYSLGGSHKTKEVIVLHFKQDQRALSHRLKCFNVSGLRVDPNVGTSLGIMESLVRQVLATDNFSEMGMRMWWPGPLQETDATIDPDLALKKKLLKDRHRFKDCHVINIRYSLWWCQYGSLASCQMLNIGCGRPTDRLRNTFESA